MNGNQTQCTILQFREKTKANVDWNEHTKNTIAEELKTRTISFFYLFSNFISISKVFFGLFIIGCDLVLKMLAALFYSNWKNIDGFLIILKEWGHINSFFVFVSTLFFVFVPECSNSFVESN